MRLKEWFAGRGESILLGFVDKRSSQTGLDVIQSWSLRRPMNAWRPDGRGMGDHWRPAAA